MRNRCKRPGLTRVEQRVALAQAQVGQHVELRGGDEVVAFNGSDEGASVARWPASMAAVADSPIV